MTGHGDARHQADGRCVTVEIRTVNSRYFKLAIRGPESYASLESRVEGLVRQHIRRGTVNVSLRIVRDKLADDYCINKNVLLSYRRQLTDVLPSVNDDALLCLPGIVNEPTNSQDDLKQDWAAIEPALRQALNSLETMRATEGDAMAQELSANCAAIAVELDRIRELSPQVTKKYEQRLTERLTKMLAEYEVTAQPSDVVREVGIFAERCDISEETVRLNSHLDQFEKITSEKESAGRKLEFLIQEMFRETNTIGSKANDAEIARHVVEIKTHVERMREMIQNVE